MSCDTKSATLCKIAIERFPFGIVFSKTAPSDLNAVNYDADFCYYYFSSGLESRCSLQRNSLCDGITNAKRDFPDYMAYFNDDVEVMRCCSEGKVKAFCEPWNPPGVSSPIYFLYTRKTAFKSRDAAFMLGCFELIDDLMLGQSARKEVPMDTCAALPRLDSMPSNRWFVDAFEALPCGFAIFDKDDNQLAANHHWLVANRDLHQRPIDFEGHAPMIAVRTISENAEVCQYYIADEEGELYRVQMTRPLLKDVADPLYVDGELVRR